MITLTATDAARNFSDLLNRVRYQREEFIIERAGEPICQITPVAAQPRISIADLIAQLSTLPRLDDDFAADVESALREQPSAEGLEWS